jgi:transcriptional regulator with XRE-family HTH domain
MKPIESILISLGNNLKKLRGNRSQKEIAEQAGMTQPRLSHIESGDGNITIRKLVDLVKALGKPYKHVLVEFRDEKGHDQVIQLCIDTVNPAKLEEIISKKKKQSIKIHKVEEVTNP